MLHHHPFPYMPLPCLLHIFPYMLLRITVHISYMLSPHDYHAFTTLFSYVSLLTLYHAAPFPLPI